MERVEYVNFKLKENMEFLNFFFKIKFSSTDVYRDFLSKR